MARQDYTSQRVATPDLQLGNRIADTVAIMTPLQQATVITSASAGPPERNDAAIVLGLRRGDPEAFAALFTAYRLPIYNFVARMVGDVEDAKDVTQDVFLKAYRQVPRDDADLALKAWLYRVATTTCLDHLRARKRRAETTPLDRHELSATTDPFEQAETGRLVEQTLGRLSERHRLALVLKDLHGLQHGEIAAIIGVSRGAAETLLFRARAAFRSAFLELSPTEGPASCPEARRAALMLVERESSPLSKRRFVEHARTCPDCRRALKSVAPGVSGLALFLPMLPLPKALQVWRVATSIAGAASAGGAGAAAGAGVSGTAAAGAGAAASGAAATGVGAASIGAPSGIIAQIAAVAGTKIAILAATATATMALATAGARVLPSHAAPVKQPHPPTARIHAADANPPVAVTGEHHGRRLGGGSPSQRAAQGRGAARDATRDATAKAKGAAAATDKTAATGKQATGKDKAAAAGDNGKAVGGKASGGKSGATKGGGKADKGGVDTKTRTPGPNGA